MALRHAGSPDAEALEPGLVDDPPGGIALRVLEDAPGVEGAARLVISPPASDLPDLPLGLVGGCRHGAQGGFDHHLARPDVAVPIPHLQFVRGAIGGLRPAQIEDPGRHQHVLGLGAVTPGVHGDGSADRTRNADHELQPAQSDRSRPPGHHRLGYPGPGRHQPIGMQVQMLHRGDQHEAVEPSLRDDDVAAATQHEDRPVPPRGDGAEFLLISGLGQVPSGSPELVRREGRQIDPLPYQARIDEFGQGGHPSDPSRAATSSATMVMSPAPISSRTSPGRASATTDRATSARWAT